MVKTLITIGRGLRSRVNDQFSVRTFFRKECYRQRCVCQPMQLRRRVHRNIWLTRSKKCRGEVGGRLFMLHEKTTRILPPSLPHLSNYFSFSVSNPELHPDHITPEILSVIPLWMFRHQNLNPAGPKFKTRYKDMLKFLKFGRYKYMNTY